MATIEMNDFNIHLLSNERMSVGTSITVMRDDGSEEIVDLQVIFEAEFGISIEDVRQKTLQRGLDIICEAMS
jgi:hypothetical protein